MMPERPQTPPMGLFYKNEFRALSLKNKMYLTNRQFFFGLLFLPENIWDSKKNITINQHSNNGRSQE